MNRNLKKRDPQFKRDLYSSAREEGEEEIDSDDEIREPVLKRDLFRCNSDDEEVDSDDEKPQKVLKLKDIVFSDEEEEKPKSRKPKVVVFSDEEEEEDEYIQAECCYKRYPSEAFAHETRYNLRIVGMKTCIYCYFTMNANRFMNDYLTENEQNCFTFYVETYADEHESQSCIADKQHSCVLCNAHRKVFPAFMIKTTNNQSQPPKINRYLPQIETFNDMNLCDVIVVDKVDSSFVLTL